MKKVSILLLVIVSLAAFSCKKEVKKAKKEVITLESFAKTEVDFFKEKIDFQDLDIGEYKVIYLEKGHQANGGILKKEVYLLMKPSGLSYDAKDEKVTGFGNAKVAFKFKVFAYPKHLRADVVCWLGQKYPIPNRLEFNVNGKTYQIPKSLSELPCADYPNVKANDILTLGDCNLLENKRYAYIITTNKDVYLVRKNLELVDPHSNWKWSQAWKNEFNNSIYR